MKVDKIYQQNAVVAFIDVLGFKDIVKANNKQKDNAILNGTQIALSESYKTAVELSHNILQSYGNTDEEKEFFSSRLKYRLFSDNLFVSFEYDDDDDFEFAVYWILSIAISYQRKLLQRNIYVRGGIAFGQCYYDEHVIFSSALIKAYELESKIAKYTRIVVDKGILQKLNKISKEHIFRKTLKKYLVKDWTGTIFLDPFKMLEALGEVFKAMANNSTPNDVMPFLEKMRDVVTTHAPKNTLPDISDEDLIEFVWENVKREIKKHKENREIQEKYLWLKEFVDWNGDYERNIEFQFLYK